MNNFEMSIGIVGIMAVCIYFFLIFYGKEHASSHRSYCHMLFLYLLVAIALSPFSYDVIKMIFS